MSKGYLFIKHYIPQQMQLNRIELNFPQQPCQKQQLTIQQQIKRIINFIIPQRLGYLIRQFENVIEFCIRKKHQNQRDFALFYSIDFKSSYYSISCSFFLSQIDRVLKKKGYYQFLTIFNDWNMNNDSGQKIIWCEDEKTIKIKTSNLLMEKKQNFLQKFIHNLDTIGQEMIQFVTLLNPNFNRISNDKHVENNIWKNYKSSQELQELKQLKNTFKDLFKFNYEISFQDQSSQIQIQHQSFERLLNQNKNALGTSGKLKQKISQYLFQKFKNPLRKKQSQQKRIVEYVKVISQQERKIQMKLSSSCCEIKAYQFSYEIFPNNSYFKETNQLIQQQVKQYFRNYQSMCKKSKLKGQEGSQKNFNGLEQEKRILVKQILLQKVALKDDILPFQNEKLALMCMRAFNCQQIAQYYLQSISNISKVDRILVKPYQKSINVKFNVNTKLILLFRVALALYFLNYYKITHRDLKPLNIPLDNSLMPKIIDFGSTCFTKLAREQNQNYCAPPLRTTRFYNKFYNQLSFEIGDVMTKKQYQTHQLFDVYSFGRITEMLLSDEVSRKYLGEAGYEFVTFLINKCTNPNPNLRLTPYMIILFLAQMQITKLSTVLATRPIKARKAV